MSWTRIIENTKIKKKGGRMRKLLLVVFCNPFALIFFGLAAAAWTSPTNQDIGAVGIFLMFGIIFWLLGLSFAFWNKNQLPD